MSRRMAPPLIVVAPLQAELLALIANTPFSFLIRAAVTPAPALRSKAAFSCRILPCVTSSVRVLAVPVNCSERAVVKLPVARKVEVPAVGFSRIPLAKSPSAPSEAAAITPAWMSIFLPAPPKVFPLLPSTSTPAPILVKPYAPETTPENARPEGRAAGVSVATLKVSVSLKTNAAVSSSP